MPRRAEIQPRPLGPDPVYESLLVTQLTNRVMLHGKKSTAEAIVYTALEKVGERTGRPPVEVLEQAVKTVTPVLEVRSRRVGGASAPSRCAGSLRTRVIGARST
jgi:small subunit ribosomal protein S7